MAPEGSSDEPVVSGYRSVRFVCVYVSLSLGVGGRVGGASLASGSFVWSDRGLPPTSGALLFE